MLHTTIVSLSDIACFHREFARLDRPMINRAAAFLVMLSLVGCTDAKPMSSQAINEMIESPLQNTVISSFETYPPKSAAIGDEDRSLLPPRDQNVPAKD